MYFISGTFPPRTGFEQKGPCYTCCYEDSPTNEPNQSLTDTDNPGQMMTGRWQQQRDLPFPCRGCSLLARSACVREVLVAKASLPDCFQPEFSDVAVSPNYLFTRSHDPILTISLVFIRKPSFTLPLSYWYYILTKLIRNHRNGRRLMGLFEKFISILHLPEITHLKLKL